LFADIPYDTVIKQNIFNHRAETSNIRIVTCGLMKII
jgi:hypothetical protein